MRLTFTLEGEPVPDQRPRGRVMGKICKLYTAPRHRKRMADIAAQVEDWLTRTETALPCAKLPFALVVTTHPGTRKDGKPRTLRGDEDNYAKLVADACEGILYENDKQSKLTTGIEGEPVAGVGKQVVDILYFDEGEDYLPALADAKLALLTALEHRDR